MYSGAATRRRRILLANARQACSETIAAPSSALYVVDEDVVDEGFVPDERPEDSSEWSERLSGHADDRSVLHLLPVSCRGDSSIIPVPDRRETPSGALAAFSLFTPHEPVQAVALSLTSVLNGVTETIRVDSPLIIVGRGAQCDLRLTHPDVSRRHACIQLLRDRALCVDLDSRTGVYWGDERRQTDWLQADCAARIGPYEIRLASPTVNAPTVNAAALFHRHGVNRTGLQGVGLRFLNQPETTPPVSLARPITLIGRAERCRLRLHDDSVSRVHSSLMLTPDGVWIADLLGRGGVKVNGEFVSLARLTDGDEVQIGRYRLAFATNLPVVAEDVRPATAVNASRKSSRKRRTQSNAVSGGVSETTLLAITETFADMHRQMNEQFRFQMDLMVGLIESMRAEMSQEIRAELSHLVSLGEEIRDAQRRMTQHALPGPTETNTDQTKSQARHLDTSTDVTSGPAGNGRASQRRVASKSAVDPRPSDGIADHVYLARRLRELECERNSRWERLVGLLKGGS